MLRLFRLFLNLVFSNFIKPISSVILQSLSCLSTLDPLISPGGTAGSQGSVYIPSAESSAHDTWPTIADANNADTRSQRAVNTQGSGAQPPRASLDSPGPSTQQDPLRPPLLTIPNALSETLMDFPDGGPMIHGLKASKLYARTHQESRSIFQSHPGEKMVLFPPGKEPSNPTLLILGVRHFLQELFPHNQLGTLIIGTPRIVKLDDERDFKAPFPIFVGNLTLQEKQLLLSRPVWVTPSLTLFAQEFLPTPSSFVMTLRGFTVPPEAAYEENVKAVVHDKIKFSAAFSGFIRKYHDNIPPPPNADDNVSTHVVDYILNSINVKLLKIIENGLDVALFNIYIYPPSKILKHHAKWLALLRGNVYTMTEGARSPLKTPYNCSICRGEDHPTGLCAFTKLPGWIDRSQAAAAMNVEGDDLTLSIEAGSSRGNRNRGRGAYPNSNGRGRNKTINKGQHGGYSNHRF
ncbi:hypothetical protein M422DRAFT_247800 [Sphaerobolus stellatus SS14]|nr:hypothetical protein M422DRAFT_247800 [Sphaerobolus stellatus SS14]